MIQLDFADRRPIYEQIRDKIKELIISGVLHSEDKIPSVREMATSLTINPNTIQKAYKELENEGYIYSQKSKGYFVASSDMAVNSKNVDGLFEEFLRIVEELRFLGVLERDLIERLQKIYKEEIR